MPAEARAVALPVVIVVAAADNDVIGRDNGLIWRLKTDLRRFRALTLGRPLVMGRLAFPAQSPVRHPPSECRSVCRPS